MKVVVKLIKREIPLGEIVKDDRRIHSEVIENVGTFYYKISRTVKPDWLSGFFLDRLQCADKFRVSSAAGVLIVTRDYNDGTRTFAVTFGSGRYLLKDDVAEERFGLKIALNSIQYNSLRSIDFNKMEGVPSIIRNQVSRLTGIEDFNINTQVNLLKSITGTPPINRQDDIGKSMTGSDSLSISSSMTVNSVKEKLDQLFGLYKSEAYKQHFAWVDNISAIADRTLIDNLEMDLIARINRRELDNVWMALPAIVDWSEIDHLKYSGRNREKHDDVDIEQALSELFDDRNDISRLDIVSTMVKLFNTDGIKLREWSMFKCLYAEVGLENKLYILSEGCWYRVDGNYYDAVESLFRSVLKSDVQFIGWEPRVDDGREKYELEGDYNKRLAESNPDFCNMDRDLVYPQDNRDKIEFCDVFGKDGQIIHVKRKGGSELIGHLLNQGLVSATVLLTEEFRKKLNTKLNESGKAEWCVPLSSRDFDAGQYSIVYGLMCNDNNAELNIPFFSKVVMKEVVTTLRNYGFKVYLNKIGRA